MTITQTDNEKEPAQVDAREGGSSLDEARHELPMEPVGRSVISDRLLDRKKDSEVKGTKQRRTCGTLSAEDH